MVLVDHEREELLNDYIDGRLAESEREQVEIMLAKDEALRAELEQYQLISRAIRTAPTTTLVHSFAAEIIPNSRFSTGSSTQIANARFYRIAASIAAVAATLLLAWIVFQVNPLDDGRLESPQVADSTSDGVVGSSGLPNNAGVTVADNNPETPQQSVDQENQRENVAVNSTDNPQPSPNNPLPENSIGNAAPNTQDLVNMQLLKNQRFLFVMEIGLSPTGSKNETVKDVLMARGIMFDKGVALDREVEEDLLESRFLPGVARKPSEKDDTFQQVELIYMVCSGLQVDESAREFHGRHDEIAAYRFNLAVMKPETRLFDHLHDAAGTQWVKSTEENKDPDVDGVARRREQLKRMQGKAGKVLLELVALAGSNLGGSTALLSSGNEIPAPPPSLSKRGNAKTSRKPGQMVLGGDLLCEVLVIVRHMTEEEIKQRAGNEK